MKQTIRAVVETELRVDAEFWLSALLTSEISEGQAAKLMNTDRLTVRSKMTARFGEDWRDLAESIEAAIKKQGEWEQIS